MIADSGSFCIICISEISLLFLFYDEMHRKNIIIRIYRGP